MNHVENSVRLQVRDKSRLNSDFMFPGPKSSRMSALAQLGHHHFKSTASSSKSGNFLLPRFYHYPNTGDNSFPEVVDRLSSLLVFFFGKFKIQPIRPSFGFTRAAFYQSCCIDVKL